MGMNPDTKPFERWLKQNFRGYYQKNNSWKNVTLLLVGFIISTALFAGSCIGLGLMLKANQYAAKITFVTINVISGMGIILFLTFWLRARKNRHKQPQQISHTNELYDKFWELCYEGRIPLTYTKFDETHPIQFEFHTLNDEKIIWKAFQIEGNSTLRKVANASAEIIIALAFEADIPDPLDEINPSHVLCCNLTAYSPKLTNCEGIVMAKRNLKVHLEGKTYDLATPSMTFNKKFKISIALGAEQQMVARIFNPSVVRHFDEMNYISNRADFIAFHDGYVNVKWQDLPKQKDQGRSCINNFSFMNYTYRHEAKAITKKLQEDYEWFFENLAMLQPFGLYQF